MIKASVFLPPARKRLAWALASASLTVPVRAQSSARRAPLVAVEDLERVDDVQAWQLNVDKRTRDEALRITYSLTETTFELSTDLPATVIFD